jgi:hypothetical protein
MQVKSIQIMKDIHKCRAADMAKGLCIKMRAKKYRPANIRSWREAS